MGIVVIGAAFVDIKGFPLEGYVPTGRNVGRIEYVHGGVSRNVVEDIANVDLHPTYLGIVDNTPLGEDVKNRLAKHNVNVDYVMQRPLGMGTWLAVFNNDGDVAGSISQRPDMQPLVELLNEKGDTIFQEADSIIVEADLNEEIIEKVFELADKYSKKVFAVVSNMSLVAQRRDFIKRFDCFICNEQEAGILFADDYTSYSPEKMSEMLAIKTVSGRIPSMIVTMGGDGAVYADKHGNHGVCPARKVLVKDTTGAGDAFCAGVAIGLTYGKNLPESIEIGTYLAASVITSLENVCPKFLPSELGIEVDETVKKAA